MAQDASYDPEPIMLEEAAARRDPTLQAILRSEVGLEAYDSAQLARQATLVHACGCDLLWGVSGRSVWCSGPASALLHGAVWVREGALMPSPQ